MVETDGTSTLREQLERMFNPPEDEYIQQFIDMAQARLPVAEREQNEELRVHLLEMIRYSKTAMKHFEQGKLGAGLVAIGWMHEHRAKCGLPYELSKAQGMRGEGKTGKYGPVRKILTWLYLEAPENADIFERWRKTRKAIDTGNGEKWLLFATRIDESFDALGTVKPADYEYFYADRSDEDTEIIHIPVSVEKIKRTLKTIKKEIQK
jgi:hypothetical protein